MDQPTRRLDPDSVTEPLGEDTDPEEARSCLRCGAAMLQCGFSTSGVGGMVIRRKVGESRMARIMNGSPDIFARTVCVPFVCPQCGYTEIVAQNPGLLLDPPAPSILSRIDDLLPDS